MNQVAPLQGRRLPLDNDCGPGDEHAEWHLRRSVERVTEASLLEYLKLDIHGP